MNVSVLIIGIVLIVVGPMISLGAVLPRFRWRVGDGSRFMSPLDHVLMGLTGFYFGLCGIAQEVGLAWITQSKIIFSLVGSVMAVGFIEQVLWEIKACRARRRKQGTQQFTGGNAAKPRASV